MDGFGGSSSSSGPGVSNEGIMDQLKQQLAQAYAQELFEVSPFCFP